MFDLAWSELALIAVVAVVVIGPKDLPDAIRNVAKGVQKLRRMASEFQSQADELVREAKLEDVRDQIRDIRNFDLKGTIEKNLDGDGSIRKTFTEDPLKDAWKPETTTNPTGVAATPTDGVIAAPADGTVVGETPVGEAVPGDTAAAEAAAVPAWMPPEVAAEVSPPLPAQAELTNATPTPAEDEPDWLPPAGTPAPVPATRDYAAPPAALPSTAVTAAVPAPIPPAAETADVAPGKPATPSV